MTNIPANKTTVESERPENTCCGVSTPKRPNAIDAPIAVTANGISSVTKKNAATAKTHKVITAGLIKFLLSNIFLFLQQLFLLYHNYS